MKNLSTAIGLHIEPMYGIESAMELAVLPLTRCIDKQTWNTIDFSITDAYYDIRETTTEQLEQNHYRAR